MTHSHFIRNAFAQAVHYPRFAHVQKQVALHMSDRLQQHVHDQKPQVLEIGCGTGFLSHHLIHLWPEGRFLLTDIALPMVQRCQKSLGKLEKVSYLVMDGESLPLVANQTGFDLIVASMVFQWFNEPLVAMNHLVSLLKPGGTLFFSTLGPKTFQEWHALSKKLKIHTSIGRYPASTIWKRGWPPNGIGQMDEQFITVHHQDGLAFLRELKAIGAHQPTPDYFPQTAGTLRRLLRHTHSEHGFDVTYHLLYGLFVKKGL